MMIQPSRRDGLFISLLFVLFIAWPSFIQPIEAKRHHHITPTNWTSALDRAREVVLQLSVDTLATLATGTMAQCAGKAPAFTIPSLTFKGFCLQDGPTGVNWGGWVGGGGNTTQFPVGMNAAQTWDRELIYERGFMMGEEFKALGINGAMGPGINMGRVAAAGRNWESFGSDPWMIGEAGALTVQGLQDAGTIAIAKHYIANEQETSRFTYDALIDQRTFYEVYAYPFLKVVRAGTGSIMCALNKVNGTVACVNNAVQNIVLKNEFGFKGFIISDWQGGALNGALAGMDVAMPGQLYPATTIKQDVVAGRLSLARLQDMVQRVLAPYFLLGQDLNFPDQIDNNPKSVSTPAHAAHARKMAADSAVLLKNLNSFLPIFPSAGLKIAVIGSDAGPPSRRNSLFPFFTGIDGTITQGWGSGSAPLPYIVDPLQAIRSRYGGPDGSLVSSLLSNWDLASASTIAAAADVAIVFVCSNSGEGGFVFDTNTGDRNNISIWFQGDTLIRTVSSVNANTIVVMHTPGQVLMNAWNTNPNVKAIIWAGMPGQETGNGLVDILSGDVNPSGKLVYTIAAAEADYGATINFSPQEPVLVSYTDKLLVDYRWFDALDKTPLYEFGFGLSYTTFTYCNLMIKGYADPGPNSDDSIVLYNITCVITNNSNRTAGAEVAQLYIGYPEVVGEPKRVLRGFDKIMLAPGASGTVEFTLTALDLAYWDVPMHVWNLYPGQYMVWVGASSRDIRLTGFLWIGRIPTSTTVDFHASTAYFSATTAGNVVSTSTAALHSATTTNSYATTTAYSYATATASGMIATTGSVPYRPILLWSKTGLAWPDGDAANLWALAGNGWNRVSWLYTYGAWPPPSASLMSLDFVPMLWGCAGIQDWDTAIAHGIFDNVTAVLAFNEPDESTQSDLSPAVAAEIYKRHIHPLSQLGINLGAPAVSPTNKGASWLKDFFTLCKSCAVDFLPVHWFGNRCIDLQNYLMNIHDSYPHLPIWGTEWACAPSSSSSSSSSNQEGGSSPCNGTSITTFVQCTTSWMASQSWIQRYSYYGAMRDLGGHVPSSNALLSPNGTMNTPLGVFYVQDKHG
eukprot:TRINITY_DN4106_c0_g1_i15.p1 TRINITY_DN4106_c0_g1~~TRINITY_DN4106_c0_g1_i15.p1  ORF type:complete len:1078 (-),score=104.98 TRINITY_DN4106_c0_g1_i15:16-3249(-)